MSHHTEQLSSEITPCQRTIELSNFFNSSLDWFELHNNTESHRIDTLKQMILTIWSETKVTLTQAVILDNIRKRTAQLSEHNNSGLSLPTGCIWAESGREVEALLVEAVRRLDTSETPPRARALRVCHAQPIWGASNQDVVEINPYFCQLWCQSLTCLRCKFKWRSLSYSVSSFFHFALIV